MRSGFATWSCGWTRCNPTQPRLGAPRCPPSCSTTRPPAQGNSLWRWWVGERNHSILRAPAPPSCALSQVCAVLPRDHVCCLRPGLRR
eukprot:1842206-Pleurochrysis_carterae.AAC.1